MINKLLLLERKILTGLGFILFGIGSLVIVTGIVLPMHIVFTDKKILAVNTRLVIHYSCKLYILILVAMGLLKVKITNNLAKNTGKPSLIIANHPTLLDAIIILSILPGIDCLTKKSLWSYPFLGQLLRAADYIKGTGEPEIVSKCLDKLRLNSSLLIFPEGTRSEAGGLRKFQRLASTLVAEEKSVELLPVLIVCTPPTLFPGNRWHQVPDEPPVIALHFLPPLDINQLPEQCLTRHIFSRKLTCFLQNFFENKLRDVQSGQIRA